MLRIKKRHYIKDQSYYSFNDTVAYYTKIVVMNFLRPIFRRLFPPVLYLLFNKHSWSIVEYCNFFFIWPFGCVWFLSEDKTFRLFFEGNTYILLWTNQFRHLHILCTLPKTPAFACIYLTRWESIGCKMPGFCAEKETGRFSLLTLHILKKT